MANGFHGLVEAEAARGHPRLCRPLPAFRYDDLRALGDRRRLAAAGARAYHEQVVHLYEGEFELTVDGQTSRLSSGTVFAIPANIRHSGRAITDCRVMDVFCPVREDYRDGARTRS